MVEKTPKKENIIMETYTGIFHPIEPKIEEVSLIDIAHSLSLICRFGGHCKYFYSVAQHCLNVSKYLQEEGYDNLTQLIGALHDASEAYISDVITPIKKEILDYKKYEKIIEDSIYKKFGIDTISDDIHTTIKKVDRLVFFNEVLALTNNYGSFVQVDNYKKINIDLSLRNPKDVEDEYVQTINTLVKK